MSFSTSISDRAGQRGAIGTAHASPRWHGRRYLLTLGLLMALALAASALLVCHVDPYGFLGHNEFGIYAESERQAKPGMLRAVYADHILIGSSKVAYTDPAPLGPHAFNASFSAAMPEEIATFLRRHVPAGATVVVGLDSFMMNTNAYPLAPETFSTEPSRFDTLAYLFGLRPAADALETVVLHALGRPPVLRPNGQRDPSARLARHDAMSERDDARWLHYLRTHHFANFGYAEERVDALRDILAAARERRLTLHVFINPLSQPVRDLVEVLPARADVERFRADVAAALPGAVDFHQIPGFAAPDLYFRFDPFHYLPSTGARILRAVLAHPPVYRPPAVPKPFGVVRGDDYSPGRLGLTLKQNEVAPQDSSDEAVQ